MHTMPSAQHAHLLPLVGRFRAHVRLWMDPAPGAAPMDMTGVMHNALDLGGAFLAQHYTGDTHPCGGSAFHGRGYFGYNDIQNQWEGFWIDTASTVMQTETGEYDPATRLWTMRGSFPAAFGRPAVSKRAVLGVESDDTHWMDQFTDDSRGEVRTMRIEYERVK